MSNWIQFRLRITKFYIMPWFYKFKIPNSLFLFMLCYHKLPNVSSPPFHYPSIHEITSKTLHSWEGGYNEIINYHMITRNKVCRPTQTDRLLRKHIINLQRCLLQFKKKKNQTIWNKQDKTNLTAIVLYKSKKSITKTICMQSEDCMQLLTAC